MRQVSFCGMSTDIEKERLKESCQKDLRKSVGCLERVKSLSGYPLIFCDCQDFPPTALEILF